MKQYIRDTSSFAYNCQHCGWPMLRTGKPLFTCEMCKSRILVPEPGKITKRYRIGKLSLETTSDNMRNRWGKYPMQFENSNEPLLHRYRKEAKFESVFRNAKTELDSLVKLRDMLHPGWYASSASEHGWFPKRPSPAFLKRYGLWTSHRLNKFWACTEVSHMFVLTAASLGITARMLNISRYAKLNEPNMGHFTIDVWSNDYQKWIYMDVLHNFHYQDADGTPLSLLEARDLFWKNKARGLYANCLKKTKGFAPGVHHLGADKPTQVEKLMYERTLNTFWCVFFMGNNLFTQPSDMGRMQLLLFDDDLTRGKRMLGNGREHRHTEPMLLRETDRRDFYPTMNNAEIGLYRTKKDGADVFRVYIPTTTPNLKRIRYRIGRSQTRTYGADGFTIPAKRGTTRIEAFTENSFGLPGRKSVVTLRIEP